MTREESPGDWPMRPRTRGKRPTCGGDSDGDEQLVGLKP
jgi:hypothetical protein